MLRRRKRFSQPALAANSSFLLSLTVAYIGFTIALIILRDTLSWRAHLLITHPHMFISGSSLAFFLPPPGSLVLLLSSSDSAEAQFLSLSWGRQRNILCRFFQVFLCIFYDRKFKFQVILLIFFLHQSHQCDIDGQKASTTCEKGKEEKRAVSVVTSSSLIKKINKLRLSINLEPAVIYQNIHLHPVFKRDPAVNWNPAIIW